MKLRTVDGRSRSAVQVIEMLAEHWDGARRAACLASGASTKEQGTMADNPVDLEEHRGLVARMETEIRRERFRRLPEDQASFRRRREELEHHLHAGPSETWQEAAARAEYLIQLFAGTLQAQDPQCKALIACVLEDLGCLRQREKEKS